MAGDAQISERELRDIERVAVELANLARAEIEMALGTILDVRYKRAADPEAIWRDPVSEVDRRVEQLIRMRISERFPDHDIVGEEFDERPARDHAFVWAIDPIDGTANFVNGFPFFASAIGVLFRGRPVVGAIWCATSHRLRPGVYHGHRGGRLCFDGDPLVTQRNVSVRRRLAGVPHAVNRPGPWDTRKTGSAAIECAFVAAGLLEAAWFEAPNLWDVAGGLALVQVAGGAVLVREGGRWLPFDRFEDPDPAGTGSDLSRWRRPILIGRADPSALVDGFGDTPP